MHRPKRRARPVWLSLTRSGLILPGLVASCGTVLGAAPRCGTASCATIPRGAIPPPAGTRVNAILQGQASLAEAEDFVIHTHEWYLGGRAPGPYGRRHLATIGHRLPGTLFTVVVEPVEPEERPEASPATVDALNEARRRHVVESLLGCGVEDADRRVILAYPRAEGLYGDAAVSTGLRYLQGQTGSATGAGGFGSSGTSTGSFGGGGGLGGGIR